MYDEKTIISSFRFRKIWERYRNMIKPTSFSDSDSRMLYAKIESIHKTSDTDEIPLKAFKELPAVKQEDITAITEDFVSRICLADYTKSLLQLQSQPVLSIDKIAGEIEKTANMLSASQEKSIKFVELNDTELPRYSTGVDTIDDMLQGGLSAGEMCVIASPPHGGKTHWLVSLSSMFLQQGHQVDYYILEDLPKDIANYFSISLGEKSLLKLGKKGLSLYDCTSSKTSVAALNAFIGGTMKNYNCKKPRVVAIDYADEIHSGETEEVARLHRVFQGLRRIASRHNVILITATQGDALSWNVRIPTLRNLAGSKVGKAAVADVILFWSQLATEKNTGQGRLVTLKARGRKVGRNVLECIVDWDTFEVEFLGG